jgi:hypothetical protein
MEQGAHTRQVKKESNPETMEPLFTFAQPPEKKGLNQSHPVRLF